MQKINLQKGITLIETIVYVAIFSIFVISLTQFSTTLSTARLNNQSVLEVNDQGLQVMRLITQTLRNASNVNSPTIGTIGTSLQVGTSVSATHPTVFSVNAGTLYITEGSGAAIALTNNKVVVSNVTFSNFSRVNTPSFIKISFTLSSVSTRDPYSVTFSATSALRK